MTMPNPDLLFPLHQPAMKSFETLVTSLSRLTFTCSECHRVIRKSRSRATCTTSGQSRHLACTYLPRRERESICDGCREWRCCVTAQSPSTSTMPSRNHSTPSEIFESTMLQEVTIIDLKTQQDGVTKRPIPQKQSEATNRLHEVAPCSFCTTRIRQEPRD